MDIWDKIEGQKEFGARLFQKLKKFTSSKPKEKKKERKNLLFREKGKGWDGERERRDRQQIKEKRGR